MTTFNIKDAEGNSIIFQYESNLPTLSGSLTISEERYEEIVSLIQEAYGDTEEDIKAREADPNGYSVNDRITIDCFNIAENIQELVLIAEIKGQITGQQAVMEKMKHSLLSQILG